MYIITGASKGIGKAIAEFYLDQGEEVVGISRTNAIEHPSFHWLKHDFSSLENVEKINLGPWVSERDKIVLINNAGTLGDIKKVDAVDLDHYHRVALLNIVVPQFLCSHLLQEAKKNSIHAIVNISSGAGRRAISGWAAYCASKAAIDLFSETLLEEFKELGLNTKVYSAAPGIVDTEMQQTIRNSNPEDFSSHKKFIELKENNELRPPQEVAQLLNELLQKDQGDVICRL